jgi:acetyl-CoA synthetase
MSQSIDTLFEELRRFAPSQNFAQQAHVSELSVYKEANDDYLDFWNKWAQKLHWTKPWNETLRWDLPDAKWFVNGHINACYNCVDRHVEAGLGHKIAIRWEGEPGEQLNITYNELRQQVSRLANGLKQLGVQKGDCVCLYLPMVPELVYAMLACARIGAVHSVIFGGFSAHALYDRIQDAKAKLVITADGGWRRGQTVNLKSAVDEALALGCPSIEHVLVLNRLGLDLSDGWVADRDLYWENIVSKQSIECPCEPMDSDDLLFILYTSGSTGKPKGIMHSTGGYLTGVHATSKWVFDLKDNDVYWCTADCGWITGHSYVVYGPLSHGATILIYEGAPDFPEKDRFWDIIERHKVSIFYTAPTAIRAFMKWGTEYPRNKNLDSLRLLGSVGEPINPEAWIWYQEFIGNKTCPIVDTWWQTETGHILMTPLPGLTETKPGSAMTPFPGIEAAIVDQSGNELYSSSKAVLPDQQIGGYLVINKPWPGMLKGIYGDREKFIETYWKRFPGVYFTGDGAKVDSDGHFWLLGRVDDVMNISGHRMSTTEVESALVDHPSVAEAAVIGKPHEIKGESIAAFVILKSGIEQSDQLNQELAEHVVKQIGAIARPEMIIFTSELPKTRSGKIMRRLLRDIACGRVLGDVTTLNDPSVVQSLQQKYMSLES